MSQWFPKQGGAPLKNYAFTCYNSYTIYASTLTSPLLTFSSKFKVLHHKQGGCLISTMY